MIGEGAVSLVGGVGAGLNFEGQPGGRITIAYWWDDCQTYGWDTSFLFVPKFSLNYRTENCPFLGRQFCDAYTGVESSLLVAYPGIATGNITISAGTFSWGAETNFYANLMDDPIVDGYRVDFLVGFRYLELNENLNISSVTSFFRTGQTGLFVPFQGSSIQVFDAFANRNQFVGGQFGFVYTMFGEVGDLEIKGKLAFGSNHQTNLITGWQVRTDAGGGITESRGGLLALPTNIGRHKHNEFTIVPEMTATMRFRLCDNLFFRVGGTFIFWNRIIRPGDQIDRNVDLTQLPNFGTPGSQQASLGRPGVNFNQSEFAIYGLNLGLEFRW